MHFWDESDKGYKEMITGMLKRINGLEEALARYMPEEDLFEFLDLNPNPASPLKIDEL